jgi:5-methylcytosine-specific restriction endonuclease McrA
LAERFLVQVTIEKGTHEKLRRIQALLSHAVPPGDLAKVLDRIFDVTLETLEKRKIGAGSSRSLRARAARSARAGRVSRYIPAQVRREVWERDEGRCTFVSTTGHRCGERRFLQFDHVEPVARGGRATVQGIRLRCRAHNQYEAERVFGADFMSRKRDEARLEAVEARFTAAEATKKAEAQAQAAKEQEARNLAKEQAKDVLAGLRVLGCRADQARRAAQFVETLPCATLEERMRAALGFISRRLTHRSESAETIHANG